MNDQQNEILTIDEVAVYLKAGKRTVYRLAASSQHLSSAELGDSGVATLNNG